MAGISVGIPQLLFISPMAVRYGLENQSADDWGPGGRPTARRGMAFPMV